MDPEGKMEKVDPHPAKCILTSCTHKKLRPVGGHRVCRLEAATNVASRTRSERS